MDINSKKIYLSIILALFVLFSLLFIPCCKVFASVSIDFANYGLSQSDYDDMVEIGYSFYYLGPGATLHTNNNYGDLRVYLYGHRYESGSGFTRKVYNSSTDEISVSEHGLNPLGENSAPLAYPHFEWQILVFRNTHPILVAIYKGFPDSEESSGINIISEQPFLQVSIDMSKSSKEPNVPGSIIGNLSGYNLEPGGRLRLGLSKSVPGGSYSFVANIIDEVIVNDIINFEFSCPALELGQYVLAAQYETNTDELTDMLAFNIDGTINDVPRDISVGGNTYRTDSYFRKVFKIFYPRNNYFYEELNPERLMFRGDVKYFDRDTNGKFSYNDNFTIGSVAQSMNVNVFINGHLLTTCDISSGMDWMPNLSPSLLNRGRNSAYITSFTSRDEPDDIYSYKIGDKYYYLFDAIDFYYKTTEGYESDDIVFPTPDDDRLVGGREGDPWGVTGPGGSPPGGSPDGTASFVIGQPPNRSDYPDDILGTLNYGLAYLGWIISIPFNLLVSAFDWIVNVITSMFYWVGQLSSLIGSWFNFLPIEVRSLLMAAFVCSIVAFVIRLFRK